MTSSAGIHVLIVGSGAVGAFYGSRLHQPSASPPVLVSVVCRSNYDVVKVSGFEMQTHSYGNYQFTPHGVFRTVEEAATAQQYDYVVVTTKALPDVTDDSQLIQSAIVQSKTSIVLIQNGVGVEDPHRKRFPATPILSAVTVISAVQTTLGKIKQNRWTRISIGPYIRSAADSAEQDGAAKFFERMSNKKSEDFVNILKAGGVKDAELYDEKGLQLVRWHKIAINGSMNPSSVLSGGTGNAAMSLDPETREHLRACMIEVLETAPKVLGRPFPAKLATADAILRSTERNTEGKPSMLLDWEAGRPMELEVILGYPVKIARSRGFEMPRLQSMYALLKLAQRRRDERKQKSSKL